MQDLIKQPNGKYCVINWKGVIENYNLSEQDVINTYIEQAKQDLNNAGHFGEIINRLVESGRHDKRLVDEYQLKEMGFNKSYKELVLFVPREPVNTSYASRDFTTYGKCPNCGKGIQNGMAGKDERCSCCGQLLKW